MGAGLNHDEHQFIAPGALLSRHGLLPFRDYPIFHLQNLSFVYAALDRLSSHFILATKSFSVLCATMVATLIAGVCARHQNGRWRFGLPAILLVMLFCDPLFACTSGKTWNHDFPTLWTVAALVCMVETQARESLWLAALAGLAIGMAIGTRLTFAPVVIPLCLAPFVFPMPWSRRLRFALTAALGAGIALLPTLWLWALSPDQFVFDNLQFPRLRLLDPMDTRVHKTITFWRKVRFFFKEVVFSSWPIFVAYALSSFRAIGQSLRAPSLSFGSLLVAATLPFVLVGCFAPSRYQYQHYFAFIPLMALGAAYGSKELVANGATIRYALLILLAVFSIMLNIHGTEKGGYAWIGELGRPAKWFPMRAHLLGQKMHGIVPAGKVLTLAPAWPIEAGLDIYPEFANGPFAWRSAHLLEATKRAQFRIIAPEDLDDFLARDPPSAILTGFETDELEKPLRHYAERNGYTRVDLGKDRLLWVRGILKN